MNNNYKGTEHYTLTKTENGWHGDPDGYSWQWFDFSGGGLNPPPFICHCRLLSYT